MQHPDEVSPLSFGVVSSPASSQGLTSAWWQEGAGCLRNALGHRQQHGGGTQDTHQWTPMCTDLSPLSHFRSTISRALALNILRAMNTFWRHSENTHMPCPSIS